MTRSRDTHGVGAARRRRDTMIDRLLRRQADMPAPVITQTQQRERRRQHLPVHYTGAFDLEEELREILAPLAQRNVARYPGILQALADAVHDARLDLERLIVLRDARRRVSDLPYDRRARARDLILATWNKPAPPTIDHSRDWANHLVDHLTPLAAPIADYLGRATPPGQTGSQPSISEQVEGVCRQLDRAVASAIKTLSRADVSLTTGLTPQQRAAAELRALGITTT
ncbi:hypothetical protein [Rhodococcus sp. SJ-2]